MDGAAFSVEAQERNLGRLLSQAGLAPPYPPNDKLGTITGLTDDSRRVLPGGCFVAVQGQRCDGHDYVDAAVQAGARCIVTERPCTLPADVVGIQAAPNRFPPGIEHGADVVPVHRLWREAAGQLVEGARGQALPGRKVS